VKFTDLTPGVVIRTPPRVVTSKEIVEFASRYDPQWFHIDPARARGGRWKGLIASGWHTCAIAMELMVKHVLTDSEAFGSLGVESIKWLHPVRPDDAVALRFEVMRTGKSPSGRTGILLSKSELCNQHDRQVMTLQGTTPVRGAGLAVAGVGGHANRATAAHGEDVRAAGRCARGQNRMRATEQPAP
jgi:acyl dehydratase